ncbi:hypothetical protein PSFL111601_26940 [Pseudomonas floridensis]
MWRGFFNKATQQVVLEGQGFGGNAQLLSDSRWLSLDGQQAIPVVVGVVLTGIAVDLGEQAANGVTFEFGMPLWALCALAVAGFLNLGQVSAEVVLETAGEVVDALFFDQPVRGVVGKAIAGVVLVDQCGQAYGLVVFVSNRLAFGILTSGRQATGVAHQPRGLALAVGVGEDLAEGVVGEAFGGAVRVIDAQHFAIGFAFQPGGLVEGVGDGDQVVAVVVLVIGVLARTVLKAFDLGQCVPPQILGLQRRIDDGVRQAVIAVEVFGLVAERIEFGDEIALVVVAGAPGAAVGVIDLGDPCGFVMMLIASGAAERIGFRRQTGQFIVGKTQRVAVGQA